MARARFPTLVAVALSASVMVLSVSRAQETAPAAQEGAEQKAERVFFVPSSGWLADHTFIAASKSGGPSAMARQLASAISTAEREPFQVTVAGKSEPKTVQVAYDMRWSRFSTQ
jgi:hypothetical protein